MLRERYYPPVLMTLSPPPPPAPPLDAADTARLADFERRLDGVLHDARDIVMNTARDVVARGKPLGLDVDEGLAEVLGELHRLAENGEMTRFEAIYLLSVLASVVTSIDVEVDASQAS